MMRESTRPLLCFSFTVKKHWFKLGTTQGHVSKGQVIQFRPIWQKQYQLLNYFYVIN